MDALTASTKSKEPRKRKRRTSVSKDNNSETKKTETGNSEKETTPPPSSPSGDEKSPVVVKPNFKVSYFELINLHTDTTKYRQNEIKFIATKMCFFRHFSSIKILWTQRMTRKRVKETNQKMTSKTKTWTLEKTLKTREVAVSFSFISIECKKRKIAKSSNIVQNVLIFFPRIYLQHRLSMRTLTKLRTRRRQTRVGLQGTSLPIGIRTD